jgi:hypothetical protein
MSPSLPWPTAQRSFAATPSALESDQPGVPPGTGNGVGTSSSDEPFQCSASASQLLPLIQEPTNQTSSDAMALMPAISEPDPPVVIGAGICVHSVPSQWARKIWPPTKPSCVCPLRQPPAQISSGATPSIALNQTCAQLFGLPLSVQTSGLGVGTISQAPPSTRWYASEYVWNEPIAPVS